MVKHVAIPHWCRGDSSIWWSPMQVALEKPHPQLDDYMHKTFSALFDYHRSTIRMIHGDMRNNPT